MATYCTNDDLRLDTGKTIDSLMIDDLDSSDREAQKDASRERAYNHINEVVLRGKTAIPATHIAMLKQVEIDLVIADIMTATFSSEASNVSDWAERYQTRAEETLQNLRYGASFDDAEADDNNTGNGTLSGLTVFDDYTMTEKWILTAMDATRFSVEGELHGRVYDLTVGEPYPETDWLGGTYQDYNFEQRSHLAYHTYPFACTIAAGSTPFVQYDRFTFKTYAASFFKQRTGAIVRA